MTQRASVSSRVSHSPRERVRLKSASCSTIALATALAVGGTPAAAQVAGPSGSFQGSGSFSSGTGTITAGTGTTNIQVNSSQAVIDWTPTDNVICNPACGAINFQPAGTTATFNGASDYAVLNRINVADLNRMIALSGTVRSLIGGQTTGGKIFFYSPSGFVLTGTSAFNVGSLVLTASPIAVDASGNFINNNVVTFGQAPNPNASIVTVSDVTGTSQINATQAGSYVALVAPRVEHQGNINVNGSAALVGGEAATINFSPDGLFDISVDVGTTDGNGVVVSGDITGAASSGAGDYHRVYAVAVPKNDALTMLMTDGASLGFATSAVQDGEGIVLSAGGNIAAGTFGGSSASGNLANINITNSSFGSDFVSGSSGNTEIFGNGGSTTFAGNVTTLSGGHSWISGQQGGTVHVGGDLTLTTNAFADGAGGSATASQAAIYTQSGGALTVDGDVNVLASGFGGDGFTAGVGAGSGTGGEVLIQAEAGSSMELKGNLTVTSDGRGGSAGAAGVDGGQGTGGYVFVGALGDNASFKVDGVTNVSASGFGGDGDGFALECTSCDGLGGTGTGGTINIGTSSVQSSAEFVGSVNLSANGSGGSSGASGSASGTGKGGYVSVYSYNSLKFDGDLSASASGLGGESFFDGVSGGRGEGGSINISANSNAALDTTGSLFASADGEGGFANSGIGGGDGKGGTVNVHADGAGATLTFGGQADLSADGRAYNVGECFSCGSGGNGTGGTVDIGGAGGAGSRIAIHGPVYASGEGDGGAGTQGPGGNGQGGTAVVTANAGETVTILGDANIWAQGYGGYDNGGFGGGNGTGGTALLHAAGGTLNIGSSTLPSSAFVNASGYGGDSGVFGQAGDGPGGDGFGGEAEIASLAGGNAHIWGDARVESQGEGGSSLTQSGGDGTGRGAFIAVSGGNMTIEGSASVDASGYGGDGYTGGNGLGGGDSTAHVDGAHIVAHNGTLTINGTAGASSEGFGGDGGSLYQFNGETFDLVPGGNGGAGGNGTGGYSSIFAGNSDLGPSTLFVRGVVIEGIPFGASVNTNGYGGNGGDGNSGSDGQPGTDGSDGTAGGAGGAGGIGTGGSSNATAAAGNGNLNIGILQLASQGTGGFGGYGGNGGAGGNADGGIGGNGAAGGIGGAGGAGIGGFVQFGTESGEGKALSANQGHAILGSVLANASATGGDGGSGGAGGAGGSGTTPGISGANTAGGNGGNATDGGAVLLVRGSTLDVDSVELLANATGGSGGIGGAEAGPQGNGGNAIVGGATGGIGITVTNRFQIPGQRGTLHAGTITGTATATGGSGLIGGSSQTQNANGLTIINSDVTIDSLDFAVNASFKSGTFTDFIFASNSNVTFTGGLNFASSGDMSLLLDGSTMKADSVQLTADDFATDPANPAPTNRGTLGANTFLISSNNNVVADANFNSVADFNLVAPGAIRIGDVASDKSVNLSAGGDLRAGSINAGADIFVDAGGLLTVANLTAGGFIDLDAIGDLSFGDAKADSLKFSSDGAVDGGDVDVASYVSGDGTGAVTLGKIKTGTGGATTEDGFSVAISSPTSVSVGDVNSAGNVGFATLGALTTGNVTAGDLFMALIGGDIDVGSITTNGTGQVYFGNASMFLDAGGEEAFDPALVLAASPVPTGGSIAINGPVATGTFRAASGGNFSAGAISARGNVTASAGGTLDAGDVHADGSVDLRSNGALTAGAITAGGSLFSRSNGSFSSGDVDAGTSIDVRAVGPVTLGTLTAGDIIDLRSNADIRIGDATSAQTINFLTDGSVSSGDLTAGDSILAEANGSMTLGKLSAGLVNPSSRAGAAHAVRLASTGPLGTGNISAAGTIGLYSAGTLTTGNLDSGLGVLAMVDGDMHFGSINTHGGYLYLADDSMAALGGTFDNFDRNAVLAAAPVASSGSITITGPVQTGRFQAAAGTSLSTGDINAAGNVSASGGTSLDMGDVTGQAIALQSGGTVTGSKLAADGALAVDAGADSSVGDVTATDASFHARGTASFLGTVSVPTITVTSRNVDVAAGGSLGVFGVTDLLTLNAVSDQPIVIGSGGPAATAGAYVLDEPGDIEAANIVVNAVAATGSAAPDVHIFDVDIDGSGTSGGGASSVEVNTTGSIMVGGAVNYANAGAGDELRLNSGDKIEVVTDTGGSIAMTGTAGELAGKLRLTGHDVWVADQATLGKLEANANYSERDTDLGHNAGANNQAGNLQAGGITVDLLGSSLMVQNSGTPQQPAGLSVGSGGLTIINEGTDPATIILYGRQVVGGTINGGADFIPAVTRTGSFSTDSRVNGCDFGGCAPSAPTTPIGAETILGPIGLMTNTAAIVKQDSADDFLDELFYFFELNGGGVGPGGGDEESDDATSAPDFWQGPINTGPVSSEKTIDDPVTSGSDGAADGPK